MRRRADSSCRRADSSRSSLGTATLLLVEVGSEVAHLFRWLYFDGLVVVFLMVGNRLGFDAGLIALEPTAVNMASDDVDKLWRSLPCCLSYQAACSVVTED